MSRSKSPNIGGQVRPGTSGGATNALSTGQVDVSQLRKQLIQEKANR